MNETLNGSRSSTEASRNAVQASSVGQQMGNIQDGFKVQNQVSNDLQGVQSGMLQFIEANKPRSGGSLAVAEKPGSLASEQTVDITSTTEQIGQTEITNAGTVIRETPNLNTPANEVIQGEVYGDTNTDLPPQIQATRDNIVALLPPPRTPEASKSSDVPYLTSLPQMEYKEGRLVPKAIESISQPLPPPVFKDGRFVPPTIEAIKPPPEDFFKGFRGVEDFPPLKAETLPTSAPPALNFEARNTGVAAERTGLRPPPGVLPSSLTPPPITRRTSSESPRVEAKSPTERQSTQEREVNLALSSPAVENQAIAAITGSSSGQNIESIRKSGINVRGIWSGVVRNSGEFLDKIKNQFKRRDEAKNIPEINLIANRKTEATNAIVGTPPLPALAPAEESTITSETIASQQPQIQTNLSSADTAVSRLKALRQVADVTPDNQMSADLNASLDSLIETAPVGQPQAKAEQLRTRGVEQKQEFSEDKQKVSAINEILNLQNVDEATKLGLINQILAFKTRTSENTEQKSTHSTAGGERSTVRSSRLEGLKQENVTLETKEEKKIPELPGSQAESIRGLSDEFHTYLARYDDLPTTQADWDFITAVNNKTNELQSSGLTQEVLYKNLGIQPDPSLSKEQEAGRASRILRELVLHSIVKPTGFLGDMSNAADKPKDLLKGNAELNEFLTNGIINYKILAKADKIEDSTKQIVKDQYGGESGKADFVRGKLFLAETFKKDSDGRLKVADPALAYMLANLAYQINPIDTNGRNVDYNYIQTEINGGRLESNPQLIAQIGKIIGPIIDTGDNRAS